MGMQLWVTASSSLSCMHCPLGVRVTAFLLASGPIIPAVWGSLQTCKCGGNCFAPIYLLTSLACTPPPGCKVKYLSCIVLIYHRFDMSSNSSWKVSWSDISSWLAVTSTPAKINDKSCTTTRSTITTPFCHSWHGLCIAFFQSDDDHNGFLIFNCFKPQIQLSGENPKIEKWGCEIY